MPQPSTPSKTEFLVGTLQEATLAHVASLVGSHPPFYSYAFGLMMQKLRDQLHHQTNVMAIHQGRLVGFAGWIRASNTAAQVWQTQGGDVPMPDWLHGDAIIVTILVADRRELLWPLCRGISHACANLPVYRMRTFPSDERHELRRPPITGRKHA